MNFFYRQGGGYSDQFFCNVHCEASNAPFIWIRENEQFTTETIDKGGRQQHGQ